ncbi:MULTISPECIES: hypothetical protein [Bradyrhizobium]|uniref:hypothetical protein n=1 Tax=Bradyrhizobium TaxID=374 RepID=UPI00115F8C26|nr:MULTISPECIES: hypothetical protein [Bradyrhizobium]
MRGLSRLDFPVTAYAAPDSRRSLFEPAEEDERQRQRSRIQRAEWSRQVMLPAPAPRRAAQLEAFSS